MQIERHADGEIRPDGGSHARQDLAVRIGTTNRHHRAVQCQQQAVEFLGAKAFDEVGADFVEDLRRYRTEGVAQAMSKGTG